MGLPKKARTGIFEQIKVNIYDVTTKEIVFTGGSNEACNFLGVGRGYIAPYLKSKKRIKKKYAIRIAKQNNMSNTKNKPGIHLHKTEHYTGGVEVTWYWNIIASNGREIARSSETYTRKAGAVKSIKVAARIFMDSLNAPDVYKAYYDHSKPDCPLQSYL
jgi:hypothetical protein